MNWRKVITTGQRVEQINDWPKWIHGCIQYTYILSLYHSSTITRDVMTHETHGRQLPLTTHKHHDRTLTSTYMTPLHL